MAKIATKDEEARYRDFKEQLVREKSKIKRLQEIENLKAEITNEAKKLGEAKKQVRNMYSDDFFSTEELGFKQVNNNRGKHVGNRSFEINLDPQARKSIFTRNQFKKDPLDDYQTEHERFIDKIRKRVESQNEDNRFGSAAPYDTHV